jgi:Spy/CpxP family protein refolding chaperone
MKLLSTLTLAALLTSGAVFAATTPGSAPTATPAPAAQPAEKHNSAMHCQKEAKAKNLTGDEEKKFVKDCRAGKKPS